MLSSWQFRYKIQYCVSSQSLLMNRHLTSVDIDVRRRVSSDHLWHSFVTAFPRNNDTSIILINRWNHYKFAALEALNQVIIILPN